MVKNYQFFYVKPPFFLANYAVVQTSDVVHLGVVYLGCSPNSGRPNVTGSPNGNSPNTLVKNSFLTERKKTVFFKDPLNTTKVK